jgi:hypothetical protein
MKVTRYRKIPRCALVCCAIVGLALPAAAQVPPTRPSPFVQLLMGDGSVRFEQVTWDLDFVHVPDSEWGQVCINPDALERKLGPGNAYVNVFMFVPGTPRPLWAISNMFVPAAASTAGVVPGAEGSVPGGPPRRQPVCQYFDLTPDGDGSPGRVRFVYATVLASKQPLPLTGLLLPAIQKFRPTLMLIFPRTEDAEGFDPDPILNTRPPQVINELSPLGPPPAPFTPPPGPIDDLVFPVEVYQTAAPNIECAKNQCAPMAQTNMIQFLENNYNGGLLAWNVPHLPTPGIGRTESAGDVIFWVPIPPGSLTAQVDALTRRTGVYDFETGGGSSICQMYHGLMGYLNNNGPFTGAVYRHQGSNAPFIGEGFTCEDPLIDLGNVSTREGEAPTWQWMFDQLSAGRGVTICFGRYDVDGNRTSGHCIRVWGASRIGNTRYIHTLDDGNQGGNNVGLRTQTWTVADTGSPGNPGVPDGRLNMNGSTWEIEFANSVQPLPTLLIP